MSHFLAEFPLNKNVTENDILLLGVQWISGMKSSRISFEDISKNEKDEIRVDVDGETFEAIRVDLGEGNLAGLGHSILDDEGRRWTSQLVYSSRKGGASMSVNVVCDHLSTQPTLPTPKKPYFIKMIMEQNYAGEDGIIFTSDSPHYLEEGEIDKAAVLISGESRVHLPVVYVSCKDDGGYLVDPIKLSRSLSGLAHVIVEPSRRFSHLLAQEVDFTNTYGGTIGVYWPDGAGMKKYFLGEIDKNQSDLVRSINRGIIFALANRRPLEDCNWKYLQEQNSISKIKNLKESGEKDYDKFEKYFEEEFEAKESQIEAANKEIDRLKQELKRLKSMTTPSEGGGAESWSGARPLSG